MRTLFKDQGKDDQDPQALGWPIRQSVTDGFKDSAEKLEKALTITDIVKCQRIVKKLVDAQPKKFREGLNHSDLKFH